MQRNGKNTKNIFLGLSVGILIILFFPMLMPQEKIGFTNEDGFFSVFHTKVTAFHSGEDKVCSFSAKDIAGVKLLKQTNLGSMKNGIETKKCFAGNWKSEELGNYYLFAYKNVDQYVLIETSSGFPILMNLESCEMTQSFYRALIKLTEQQL